MLVNVPAVWCTASGREDYLFTMSQISKIADRDTAELAPSHVEKATWAGFPSAVEHSHATPYPIQFNLACGLSGPIEVEK